MKYTIFWYGQQIQIEFQYNNYKHIVFLVEGHRQRFPNPSRSNFISSLIIIIHIFKVDENEIIWILVETTQLRLWLCYSQIKQCDKSKIRWMCTFNFIVRVSCIHDTRHTYDEYILHLARAPVNQMSTKFVCFFCYAAHLILNSFGSYRIRIVYLLMLEFFCVPTPYTYVTASHYLFWHFWHDLDYSGNMSMTHVCKCNVFSLESSYVLIFVVELRSDRMM